MDITFNSKHRQSSMTGLQISCGASVYVEISKPVAALWFSDSLSSRSMSERHLAMLRGYLSKVKGSLRDTPTQVQDVKKA